MAWVRLHDNALTHPKLAGLVSLSHPFTLWIWGLSYCQAHLTDGLIPRAIVPKSCKRAITVLLERGLWELHADGWTVHGYLDWNDSRQTVEAKKKGLRERQARYQDKRVSNTSPRTVVDASSTSGWVKSTSSPREEELSKPDSGDRAGRLLQELYPAWYAQYRHGARLRLVANTLAYQDALTVCDTWDDARIEKLARIFLTTDEDWISRTDRGFRIFCSKASWCDDRLTQWEQSQRTA